MKRKWILVMGAAVLGAAAMAATIDAVKLAWTVKKGDSYKYALKATGKVGTPAGEGDFSFSAMMTIAVTDVKDDGKFEVESKQASMKVQAMGQEFDMPDSTTKQVFAKNGEMLESKSESTEGGDNPRMENANAFIYPDKEVKIGDTWEYSKKGDSAKGYYSTKITYKYEADEKIGERNVRKITVTGGETDAPENLTFTGTVWLDATTGLMIKSDYKMKNVPLGDGISATTMDATTTLEG